MPKIELELYKPHHYQKLIHKACEDKQYKYVVVVAGRQSGKTIAEMMQAIVWAFSANNISIGLISPSDAQCIKIQNDMINMLQNTGVILASVKGIQNRKIKFINGSEIVFKSSKSENTIRGNSWHYLICDEMAYISEDIFQNILFPCLAVKGKKMLICSTPKGKNFLYRMYMKGVNAEPEYISFKFNSADNPKANQSIIDEARRTNSDAYFKQEYEAEFVDKAGVFQSVDYCAILERQQPFDSFKYFFGIDVGLKNDSTVISIFDNNGNNCDFIRLTKVEAVQVKNKIVELNQKWKPKKILIEQNGMGLPILQDLKTVHKLSNIEGFTTDNKNKERIINNLVYAQNNGECLLLNDALLKNEFKSFVVSYNQNGNPQFFGDSGHDDIVMATAIAYECYQKNKSYGSYSVM